MRGNDRALTNNLRRAMRSLLTKFYAKIGEQRCSQAMELVFQSLLSARRYSTGRVECARRETDSDELADHRASGSRRHVIQGKINWESNLEAVRILDRLKVQRAARTLAPPAFGIHGAPEFVMADFRSEDIIFSAMTNLPEDPMAF